MRLPIIATAFARRTTETTLADTALEPIGSWDSFVSGMHAANAHRADDVATGPEFAAHPTVRIDGVRSRPRIAAPSA